MRRCLYELHYDEDTCEKRIDYYMYLDSLIPEETFEADIEDQAEKETDFIEKIDLGYLIGIPILFVLGNALNTLAIWVFTR